MIHIYIRLYEPRIIPLSLLDTNVSYIKHSAKIVKSATFFWDNLSHWPSDI